MSKDLGPFSGGGGGDGGRIVLVSTNGQYWLYEGVEHIDAMLIGSEDHPRPVLCLVFDTIFDLNSYLPEGESVQRMWAINPEIIERMRRDNILDERLDPGR